MNINEAYKILGVDESISDDELKLKYRELAFKYHPDRNKDQPNKLAEINEAHQLIKDARENPHKYQQPFNDTQGFNINDLFVNYGVGSPFGQNQSRSVRNVPPPYVNVSISFKDSVLGIDREIKYQRHIKCSECDGSAFKPVSNGCKTCNGFGRTTTKSGNTVYTQTCNSCYGRNIKQISCEKCKGSGTTQTDINGSVHIQPGTLDSSTLAIRGKGHFIGNSFFGDSYTDVYVHVRVEKEEGLEIINKDVVSKLSITLLDALKGTERDVKTILGNHKITIPPLSKNNDEIKIPGLGVKSHNGVQRIIINVQYPSDTKKLIDFLSAENN